MFKFQFYQGLFSGIMAAIAAIIYSRIYYFATEADFSGFLGIIRIISLNLIVSFSAASLNWLLLYIFKMRGEVIFNFVFSIASFALVIVPISISLPLNIKSPELFPGLAVPMVFFPALAWYTINPFFRKN